MKLDKQDKIAIGIAVAALIALYFMLGKNSAADPLSLNFGNPNVPFDLPQASTNLPWWLKNNNSPNFGSNFTLPLPTLAQNNAGCDTCSLLSL